MGFLLKRDVSVHSGPFPANGLDPRVLFFFIILMLFVPGSSLFAQQETAQPQEYRIGEDGNIIQTLSWSRSNAYYYVVEIEKQSESGAWVPEAKQKTEELSIEVSLDPGMYRYRILSYNVLDKVAATSEWSTLRIFAAKEAVVDSYSPEAFHVDGVKPDNIFTLKLQGRNLVKDAEIYIIEKVDWAKPIQPLSVTYSGDEASLEAVFAAPGLNLGAYDIVITNPGGLQTRVEGFRVSFRQSLDINVSLGYAPIIPFRGYIFTEFDRKIYPLGFYAKLAVVPYKRLWGSLGFELAPQWISLKTDDDFFTLQGQLAMANLNIFYQRWFMNYRMALNFKAGGGLALLNNIRFDYKDGTQSEKVNTLFGSLDVGINLQYYIWQDLFAEAELDYVQLISSISPAPGFVQFMVGLGWRF